MTELMESTAMVRERMSCARRSSVALGSKPAAAAISLRRTIWMVGRLSVLTAGGESRVHPGAALYDESGLSGPAVGDWVALRGELAVAVLPRTSAFVRTVAGRTSAAQVIAANLDTVIKAGWVSKDVVCKGVAAATAPAACK